MTSPRLGSSGIEDLRRLGTNISGLAGPDFGAFDLADKALLCGVSETAKDCTTNSIDFGLLVRRIGWPH